MCFCLLIVTVEEPQHFIFHKHVSFLETSTSLIFFWYVSPVASHEVGSSGRAGSRELCGLMGKISGRYVEVLIEIGSCGVV